MRVYALPASAANVAAMTVVAALLGLLITVAVVPDSMSAGIVKVLPAIRSTLPNSASATV